MKRLSWIVALLFYLSTLPSLGSDIRGFENIVGIGTGTISGFSIDNVMFPDSPWVNIRTFNDNIQAAIDALPSTGGVVMIPHGVYEITTAIDPGSKAVTLQGAGWSSLVGASFGDSQWVAEGGVKGTVIKATGTNDGIQFTSSTIRGVHLKDLAILGPGSGSSSGINYSTAGSVSASSLVNVGVFNFSVGVNVDNSISNEWYGVTVRGNTKGIKFGTTTVTDLSAYRVVAENNTTGIEVSGSGLRFYGGLIQSNTTGLSVLSAGSILFDGYWFENNTSSVSFNLVGNATDLTFSNCRESSTRTISFPSGGAYSVSRLKILNSQLTGWTLDFLADGYQPDMKIISSVINAINNISYASRIGLYGATLAGTGANLNQSAKLIYTISFSSTINPDWLNGDTQYVVLTDHTTIEVPTNAPAGAIFTLYIRQNGTGSYNVTWGSGYHYSWSNDNNVAWRYASVVFLHQGSGQWIQIGASMPWSP